MEFENLGSMQVDPKNWYILHNHSRISPGEKGKLENHFFRDQYLLLTKIDKSKTDSNFGIFLDNRNLDYKFE